MATNRLTDCDVMVAATLATISIAPRDEPEQNNEPYVARALTAFEHLLVEIARRGGTVSMREEAREIAEALDRQVR